MTEDRLPNEAVVRLGIRMGTTVGGEADEISRLSSSIDRAQEGIAAVAGSSALGAVRLYESAIKVRAMAGEVCLSHGMVQADLHASQRP